MITKLARRIVSRPKLIIAAALLLLIPSLLGFLGTKVNYDVLSYLPEDIRSVEGEKLLEDPFKAAATSMVIVEGMPAKYTGSLVRSIEEVDHVSNVLWISDLLGIQVPTGVLPKDLKENFFSDDATMMIVQFDTALSSDETMDAVAEIRRLTNEHCFVSGMSAVVQDIKELVLSEIPIYTVIAVILTLAVLLICFESPVLPFLFLNCIGLAIAYNMGTNIFLGQISYITSAIAAILQLGVTMDYSVFLFHRYEEEKTRHEDLKDAMASAMATAFASLSGSSTTTIAGFLALCAMRFGMGKDLGIVMAKGVVFGLLCVIFVLPCFILTADPLIHRFEHRNLFPDFSGFNRWILKRKRLWLVLFFLILAPAYYAQSHTGIYYQITRSLPETLPSIRSNEKLKEHFNMASQHVAIITDDIDNASLQEMEDRLKAVPGIEQVLSWHSILGDGIPEFFLPQHLRDVFKKDGYQLVMMTTDFGPATNEMKEQLRSISEILTFYDPEVYLTGEGAMTEDLRTVFDKDYLVTSRLSILAIFLIVMITFRSLTVPVALITAIETAIYVNIGICYFQGNYISFIAPTLISAIQLGATVDYAILMSTRFQEEIRNGRDRMEAVLIAGTTSDRSIITSSLVMLSANIGVILVSRLYLIKEVCVLLARGAIISASFSMFFLPCILYEMEPLFRRTSLHWADSGNKNDAS
ncbi:MAG: MMPL family transporter [Stomatobaculum sp.]|nr:MMPL family transporter [Stomatobaculum sp.]